MSDMNRDPDPSMDDILASVSRIIQQERDGELAGAHRERQPRRAAPHPVSMPENAPPSLAPAPVSDSSPAAETFEDDMRAALLRAATAVVEPWIGNALPGEIEAAVATALAAQLEPALTRRADTAEKRLSTNIDTQISAAEERLAELVPQAVAAQVAQDLGSAVKKEVSAAEEQLAALVPDAVAAQVAHDLDAALECRMAAAEARIADAAGKRLSQEIGAAVSREIASFEQRLVSAVTNHVRNDIRAHFARLAGA